LSAERKCLYRFDDYCLDSVKRLLLRNGELVPLTPKSLAILLELVERRGQVVAKADLVRRVWPGAFVSEGNLTQNVFALRKALGETANETHYVATVPGQGYSFVAEVEEIPRLDSSSGIFPVLRAAADAVPDVAVPAHPAAAPAPSQPLRVRLLLAAGILAVAAVTLAGMGLWPFRATGPPQRPCVAVLTFRNLAQRPAEAWLGSALAEMLITELGADPRMHIVSGDGAAQGDDPLQRLHTALGADRVVMGTYLVTGAASGAASRIRVDLRVVRAPAGEAVATLTTTGNESELFELVAHLGADLRRSLAPGPPGPATSPPPSR
jgi:DNA-binding winged helix-turn-helix (wHTH) protein/TolB-like protein